ncbi:MAG: YesL family protein [Streptococcaceae bacterium]|nr:YesL family protein [Streptococcaceae bacterium]
MGKLLNVNSPVMRVMARVTDLVILNTLFILTALPLITIGASLCALQTNLQKILRQRESGLVRDYFRVFKQNFKQATLFWMGILLLVFILFADFRLINRLPIPVEFLLGVAAGILAILLAVVAIYGFAYLGRYENSMKMMLRNVIVLSLQNLFQTIFLLVFNGFVIYFTISSPEALLTMIYVFTFGGFSVVNLASAVMIKQVFDRIEKNKKAD